MNTTLEKLKNGKSALNLLLNKNFDSHYQVLEQKGVQWALLEEGILECSPHSAKADKSYIISAAIHGNETAPIEILDKIISAIFKDEIRPIHPVLFIFGNIEGMRKGTREIVFNLNRLFSSHHEKIEACYEKERAILLEKVTTNFKKKYLSSTLIHYDLHTAIKESFHEKFAIYPFIEGKKHSCEQIKDLEKMGIEAILFSNKKASTFSHFTSEYLEAYGFTLELGKVHPFGQNPQENFKDCHRTLVELITGQDSKGPVTKAICYSVEYEILKKSNHFHFNFPSDTKNFTPFKKDFVIFEDNKDIFKAPEDGLRIVFPNEKVAIGQRSGLLVKEVLVDVN